MTVQRVRRAGNEIAKTEPTADASPAFKLLDVVRDVEREDLAGAEGMDMAAVSVLRVARRNVEVAGHLVHLQDAPHHASLRGNATAAIRLILATLRRVVVDKPRVPSALQVGIPQLRTAVAALAFGHASLSYLVTHVGTKAASAVLVQLILHFMEGLGADFLQDRRECRIHRLVRFVQVDLHNPRNHSHLLLSRNVHQIDRRLYT